MFYLPSMLNEDVAANWECDYYPPLTRSISRKYDTPRALVGKYTCWKQKVGELHYGEVYAVSTTTHISHEFQS